MNDSTGIAGDSLASALERNQIDWVIAQGDLPGVELHVDDDAVWTRSTLRGRPSHLCGMRFRDGDADGRLASILAVYRRARCPVSVWVGPGTTPADIEGRLRRRRLRCEKRFPGMALRLDEARQRPIPEGVRVTPSRDLAEIETAGHPLIGAPTTPLRRRQHETLRLLAASRPDTVRYFVARSDDEVLGVGTLFVSAGVAGIYDVGVHEQARRRGVGTALTLAIIDEARELGLEAAVLLSSAMGEALYRALGFRDVCDVSLWYYSRAQQRRESGEGEPPR